MTIAGAGRRRLLGAVMGAVVAVLAGCADASTGSGPTAPSQTGSGTTAPSQTGSESMPPSSGPAEYVNVLLSDVQRRQDGAPAEAARKALAGFGIDLLRQVAGAEPNTVISPYSLYSVLAMVRAGADGETARQLDEALHAAGTEQQGAVVVAVDQALAAAVHDDEVVIDQANQVWIQDGFEVSEAYLDGLAKQYGVSAVAAAFADAPEAVRGEVNSWVAERTHDLIPELFPKGSISADTRLALVNALYLKAAWAMPFGAPQGSHPFTTPDGSTVETPMMSAATPVAGVTGDGWTAVTIPYQGYRLAMTLLLPDEGSYDAVLRRLDPDLLAAAGNTAGPGAQQVMLTMPPFRTSSTPDVLEAMKRLGVTDVFDATAADLSGITGGRGLYVHVLVHQAVISVDQNGTEAAAASGAAINESAAPMRPIELTVDRPFLYWIADTTTGAPLFLGAVTNPSA